MALTMRCGDAPAGGQYFSAQSCSTQGSSTISATRQWVKALCAIFAKDRSAGWKLAGGRNLGYCGGQGLVHVSFRVGLHEQREWLRAAYACRQIVETNACHQDGRYAMAFAQGDCRIDAVAAVTGQSDVDNCKVAARPCGNRKRGAQGRCDARDMVAHVDQQALEKQTDDRFVLDDQNAQRSCGCSHAVVGIHAVTDRSFAVRLRKPLRPYLAGRNSGTRDDCRKFLYILNTK